MDKWRKNGAPTGIRTRVKESKVPYAGPDYTIGASFIRAVKQVREELVLAEISFIAGFFSFNPLRVVQFLFCFYRLCRSTDSKFNSLEGKQVLHSGLSVALSRVVADFQGHLLDYSHEWLERAWKMIA